VLREPEATFLSGVPSRVKISIARHPSDKAEAEFVARTIEQLLGGISFFSIDSAVTSGDHQDDIGGLSEIAVVSGNGDSSLPEHPSIRRLLDLCADYPDPPIPGKKGRIDNGQCTLLVTIYLTL